MKQETQNKFAAIIAAAQQQAESKSATPFRGATDFSEMKKQSETPKEYDNLKDIQDAAKNGDVISLLNLSNLVNKPIEEVKKNAGSILQNSKPLAKYAAGQKVLADIYSTEPPAILEILHVNSFENGQWVYYCTGDGQHYVKESRLSDYVEPINEDVPEIKNSFADDILNEITSSFVEPTFLDLYEEKQEIKAEVRRNEERNGIEIVFKQKPDATVLNRLKANGFRWSNYAKLWWATFTDSNLQFATSLI